MRKLCTKCKKEKDTNQFRKRSAVKSGLSPWCKECSSQHHKEYYTSSPSRRKNVRINFKNSKCSSKEYIENYLLEHPCVDCGESDIVVLDFDHVLGEKVSEVRKMSHKGYSIERISNEMLKCEVRCSNCHRRRHAKDLKLER